MKNKAAAYRTQEIPFDDTITRYFGSTVLDRDGDPILNESTYVFEKETEAQGAVALVEAYCSGCELMKVGECSGPDFHRSGSRFKVSAVFARDSSLVANCDNMRKI